MSANLKLTSLRDKIGLVSQDITLFDMSVAENIRLGNLKATQDDIEAAAKSAEIHDHIVSLPNGYETLAGPSGSRFSGGERQRIALARALVRKPAILVLDEFSSALDPTTEGEVLKTIDHLKGTCTILSVTHRLSMAEGADKVVVMRRGRVAEMGHHDELIARMVNTRVCGNVLSARRDTVAQLKCRMKDLPKLPSASGRLER